MKINSEFSKRIHVNINEYTKRVTQIVEESQQEKKLDNNKNKVILKGRKVDPNTSRGQEENFDIEI